MAVLANTLLDEAKCYECFGPLTAAQMLILAQLRRWLISLSPSADVTPQSLVEYSKCFACLGSLSMYDLMALALMNQIADLT